MQVEEHIRQYILQSPRWFGPPEKLTPDYPLIENDVLDSLGIFEMITFVEAQFGVTIDDQDLAPENFATIADVARLVSEKKPG